MMATPTLEDALVLAAEADRMGYVGTYPKALIVLRNRIRELEEKQKEHENNSKGLQADGSGESNLGTQQGS